MAPLFNKVPDRLFCALLLALGIDHDTTVIGYGRGSLAAARAAHLLYAGVSDVRLLDGGLRAWRAAALPLACGPAAPVPARDFGIALPACPRLLVDMAEARRSLGAPDTSLVSIRTRDGKCIE